MFASAIGARPAVAQNGDFRRQIGGWRIIDLSEGCAFTADFDQNGGTNLTFFMNSHMSDFMGLYNSRWKAERGAKYEIEVEFDGQRQIKDAIGTTDGIWRSGFFFYVDEAFLDRFASSRGLRIYLDGALVVALDLDGSAAALAATRRCFSQMSPKFAEQREQRLLEEAVVDDPFGGETRATPSKPSFAKPVEAIRPGSWMSADDYPAAARRAREEGTVHFRLEVDNRGRVSDCHIVQSSGSTALDQTTCALLQRRARFRPAEDARGNKIPGTYSNRFVWVLPRADPVLNEISDEIAVPE